MHLSAYIGFLAGSTFFALATFYPAIESRLMHESQPTGAVVLFGGDAFFDRTIRATMEEKGGAFVFSCINDLFSAPDLVVLNLEGPITNNASVSLGSAPGTPENFRFTFASEVAALLRDVNVRLVNLGNNHILNFGYDGVAQTLTYLEQAGVEYFGEPDTYSVSYQSINDVHLAFVSYNEFGGSAEKTKEQVALARGQDYMPVVYTHWGPEYLPVSPLYLQELAREFVDAGAELVIGSHPHVVQQSELYEGKYIYYSLGNFIFDQYFNEEVRNGLMVEVMFSKEGVADIKEIPIYLGRDRRTCVVE